MASDEEILRVWKLPVKDAKERTRIIEFYREAESFARSEGIDAMEKELITDSTIEAALKPFGWGRGKKSATITVRAIMREAACIAKEKAK